MDSEHAKCYTVDRYLTLKKDFYFRDLTTGDDFYIHREYVPGSADDAATYLDDHFRKITLEKVRGYGFRQIQHSEVSMGGLSVGRGVLWVLAWFGVMLFYTALDVAVWRRVAPRRAGLLNVMTIALCMGGFLGLLTSKTDVQIDLTKGLSAEGVLLAVVCAAGMYFLLDKFLDPILEGLLPGSEERYQESLHHLRRAPVLSFLQVCILAPVMEEILMRSFLLGGLSVSYGKLTALLISSALFALLHFNMVQTLSALLCGLMLGLLYLRTGSLVCCIAAHGGYNMISFFTTIRSL